MNAKSAIVIFILLSLLTACNLTSPGPASSLSTLPATPIPSLPFPTTHPTTAPPAVNVQSPTPAVSIPQQAVIDRAFGVITALKDKDLVALSTFVHPVSGVRFSPYAFTSDANLVFTAQQVIGLFSDSTVYTWGQFSGSGTSIDLTFAEYYSQFIFDLDFASLTQLSLNHRLGVSTSMDNSQEYYPNSMVVEFYYPGSDPQAQSLDWRSLRLVFTESGGTWYLAGIIHDQWTT